MPKMNASWFREGKGHLARGRDIQVAGEHRAEVGKRSDAGLIAVALRGQRPDKITEMVGDNFGEGPPKLLTDVLRLAERKSAGARRRGPCLTLPYWYYVATFSKQRKATMGPCPFDSVV